MCEENIVASNGMAYVVKCKAVILQILKCYFYAQFISCFELEKTYIKFDNEFIQNLLSFV